MKKLFKLSSVVLAMVMLLSCFVGLAACSDNSAEAIEKYILPEDGTLVDSDFTLPATIGAADDPIEVTWASAKPEVITIGSDVVTDKNGNQLYNAKVTLQAAETEVALTISAGSNSKSFTVRVAKLDVFTFIDRYQFPQNKATVYEDFDLASETEIQGKKATITWSVEDNASKNYISVEGNKCKVTPNGMNPKVKITGHFSYGEDTDIKSTYSFNVYVPMTPDIELDYWYHNYGVSKNMSGYVVEIATAYSESYNNVSFYMVDESGLGGYYLYRAGGTNSKLTADVAAKIKPGAYVKVTDTVNSYYNGLVETSNSNNFGGNVTVDDSKSITKEELYTRFTKDIDTLVTGDLPELLYNESRLVRLTDWTVASVASPAGKENSETLMTLTKDGKSINIQLSGYLEGAYKKADTTGEWKKLIDLVQDKKGKNCTITGILSNYQGKFQLLAIDTAHVSFSDPTAEAKPYIDTAPWAPADDVTGEYYFGFAYNNVFYFAGDASNSKYNISTTTDSLSAYKFKVAKSGDDGYTVQRTSDNKYLGLKKSGTNINCDYLTESFVWKYDAEFKGFYANFDSKDRFLGNYLSSNKLRNDGDIAPSETSFINKDDAAKAKVDVSQFVARLWKVNPEYVAPIGPQIATAAELVADELSAFDGLIVAKDDSLTLPLKSGDVTITYEKMWKNDYVALGTVETEATRQTLTITPGTIHDRVYIKVTYTIGEGEGAFSTYEYRAIETFKETEQHIADQELAQLTVTENMVQGDELTLPKAGVLYKGVTVTWQAVGELPEGITLADSKLTIGAEAKGDCTITIKATVTYGTGTANKEFSIKIPKLMIFTAITEAKAGTFAMGMKKSNWIYFTGKMDGYYYGGTIKATEAAEVVITAVEGGYTITCGGSYLEIVPRTDGSKGTNVVINKTQTKGKVWKWNAELGTFTMTSGNNTEDAEVEYFLGTSLDGKFTTFSAQAVAADASTKNAVAKFGTLAEATAE